MNLIRFSRRSSFLHVHGPDAFHGNMYHGKEKGYRNVGKDGRLEGVLRLACVNAYNLPKVFCPRYHVLVVQEDLAVELERFGCHIAPVQVDKVFEYPYAPGDRSYVKDVPYPSYEHMEAFFDRVQPDEAARRRIGDLFEAKAMTVEVAGAGRDDRIKVEMTGLEDTSDEGSTSTHRISRSSFADDPLQFAGDFLAREDLFDLLAGHMDMRFFTMHTFVGFL